MTNTVKKFEEYIEDLSKQEDVFDKDTRVCKICGCTQHNACPGGCYWIRDDLCSTCYEEFYVNAKFKIGDIVNIIVDDPTCGMTIPGTYTGVVLEHPDVGLCIAVHDMKLIRKNAEECHYPHLYIAVCWSNHKIEVVWKGK